MKSRSLQVCEPFLVKFFLGFGQVFALTGLLCQTCASLEHSAETWGLAFTSWSVNSQE